MNLKMSLQAASLTTLLTIASCATAPATRSYQQPPEIYGEIHGTRELPTYFMELVALRLKQHRSVGVGLEITDRDIKTACSSLRRNSAPVPSVSWQDSTQDGRHSHAMATLTCRLQSMRGVTLFPLISDDENPLRDKMIADAVAVNLGRHRLTLALVGNYHARNVESSAAGLLRSAGIPVVTYVFDARKPSGAWMHSSEGTRGPTAISARFCSRNEELTTSGVIIKNTPGERWDRCISLEQFTASAPIPSR